jgi:hypothetical protein
MPDGTRPVRLQDAGPPPDLLLAPLPATVPDALRAAVAWPDDLRPGAGSTAAL